MTKTMTHALWIATALLGPLTSGCLASTYRLRQDELMRLASLPPEQRGQRVRVVQDIGSGHRPTQAQPMGHYFPHVVAVGYHHPVVFAPRTARSGGRGGGSIQGGDGGDRALAVLIVIAAIATTTALVATEGARFDGWAQVDPNTPVYLRGPGGGETVMPLSMIDPQVAAWAERDGFIDHEGTAFQTLQTAPLNRVGGTFALHMGAASSPVGTPAGWGLTVRPELGGFFVPEVGVKAAYEASFAANTLGPTLSQTLGLHAQVMPVPFLGAYAQYGVTLFNHTPSAGAFQEQLVGTTAGGGVVLELGLNARLAAELRAGASWVNLGAVQSVVGSATLGIAVY